MNAIGGVGNWLNNEVGHAMPVAASVVAIVLIIRPLIMSL